MLFVQTIELTLAKAARSSSELVQTIEFVQAIGEDTA